MQITIAVPPGRAEYAGSLDLRHRGAPDRAGTHPRPTLLSGALFRAIHDDAPRRSSLAWPDGEPYEDHPRGTLKSGKEAEIFLVERRFASGPRLLAHKRYRPRYPGKGQLREEGFSNSTSYRGDAIYKAGWFLPTRDKRAVMGGSRYGHELAARLWPMQEWAMLRRAWEAGASVPYPVEQTEHGLMMEFIGDETQAAPKLAQARLSARAGIGLAAAASAAFARSPWPASSTPIYRPTTCCGGRVGWS